MKKIFTKEEAQKLNEVDAVHLWMNLYDINDKHYEKHWNVTIWCVYSTRLDVNGLERKNNHLTWDTYGINWILSTPNNSYDKHNNIHITEIKCYLETGNMQPITMVKCLDCEKEIPEDDAIYGTFDERDGYVCEDCREEYCYCENCKEYYTDDFKEVYWLRGGTLCVDCYENYDGYLWE